MHIIGHIKQGVVVPDEPLSLPDGTRVKIQPMAEDSTPSIAPEVAQFAGLIPADIDIDDTRLTSILEKYT